MLVNRTDDAPLAASRVHVLSVPTSLSSTRRKQWGTLIVKKRIRASIHDRGSGWIALFKAGDESLFCEALRKCVDADGLRANSSLFDALDDRLVSFYENQGFVPIEGRLILSVKAVARACSRWPRGAWAKRDFPSF